MELLFALLTLLGMGYAAFACLRWMLKAGQASRIRETPLSPTDLKVLEESAARLMSDLRAAADECVARVQLVLAEAEHRIEALESRRPNPTSPVQSSPSPFVPYTCELVNSSEPAVDAARQSGLTTGEVELLRGLHRISTR